mmetsp:Transcript_39656/g.78101  ORF Transcript_39656/g.78101 Transcript_39656/m.78101 type:complete len:89 (+) Transcript_39656:46-312(+)
MYNGVSIDVSKHFKTLSLTAGPATRPTFLHLLPRPVIPLDRSDPFIFFDHGLDERKKERKKEKKADRDDRTKVHAYTYTGQKRQTRQQ